MNRYRVTLSSNTVYKEIELASDMQQVKVGTGVDCDVRLRKELFFGQIVLVFAKNGDDWAVSCSDNMYLTVGDIRKLMTKKLVHGDVLEIKYQESDNLVFTMEFLIDFDDGKKKYERAIDVSGVNSLTIGTDQSCNIAIGGQYVKNDMLVLNRKADGFVVNIQNATYGMYINGKKAKSGDVVKNSDFFSVSDYFFYYKSDVIRTEIRDDMRINSLTYQDNPANPVYPMFKRNTRVKVALNDEKIEILDPPAKPQKPKNNVISRLLPSIVMVVAGIAMSFVSPFMLISSGLGVVTAIIGLIQGNQDFKKDAAARIEKYNNYIANKRRDIEACRTEEQKTLEEIYIPQQVEQTRFDSFSSDLFDRTKDDEDFLCVRLGSGDVEAKREINYKKQEKLEIEDDLQELPEKLSNEYKNVHGAPIVCDLKIANAIGVIGSETFRFEMMKNIVIDIAARQYFSDVSMFFVAEKEHSNEIHWLRMLPHVYNADIGIRNIICDDESKNIIFEYLYKELTVREQQKSFDKQLIVFLYDEYGFQSHPLSKFVDKASDIGVTFVFFGKTKADVSIGCKFLIEEQEKQTALLVDTDDRATATAFSYPVITDAQAVSIVNLLAPVYTEEISLESTLTKNISMFELLNIIAVDDINLKSRWAKSQVYKSMSAPIGVSKTGIVALDLHDKAHGPHGLVAGTTGSGKSEILQTYILAMTTLFHPYEVGFVIIDFKGGGMVNQFRDLPHLLGAITNIDGKAINRSLKSIKAELQKRQRLFADADVNHIDKYIKKYKAGEVSTPLPHLIIIVDEFAELKAEQPEFMKELISAARIGRSLGVHLILATQKPSGQVNEQIWSNSRFKLCLKVQSQEDSNEVLKSPLAAEIKEPGRAYLQVGNNEIFELFQSAYSGASEKADDSNIKEFTIYNLNTSGRRVPVFQQKKQKNGENSATQLDSIVKYVADYCHAINLPKLPDICLPALESVIEYNGISHEDFAVPVGIYDDPDNQLQDTYELNVFSENTMIVGSSMTGKTNLLQLIIRGIANKYTPKEVTIYIVDFASMVLKNFEKLAHVGGVVVPNDDEKLKNLFKLLNEEIVSRKEKLLTAGVSNFIAYKEAGYSDLSQIVLLVDNLTSLKELYFNEEDLLLPICRDGLSVGISVIISNSQTAGIGFKYFSNINQRVAFYCNDPTEYQSLFSHCKIQPENTAGRCLVQREKELYETQTFISFSGEKEFERVQEISKYIDSINSKFDYSAKHIPVVPDVLVESILLNDFGVKSDDNKMVIGLNFANVTPVLLDYSKQDVLAVSGSTESKEMFVSYLKKTLVQMQIETLILDDYSESFGDVCDESMVSLYSKKVEDIQEMLASLRTTLTERYAERELSGTTAVAHMRPIVLVINSNDAIKYISENSEALEIYKDIVKKYKNLKSMILFTNVENDTITYSSPEVMKMMKDNYQLVIFEDLSNVKLFDVPLAVSRRFKTPLKDNEAYFLSGNTLRKIKTIIKR